MKTIPSVNTDMMIAIDNLNEPTICEYFIKLNNSEFKETADLFADQGLLNPPFDEPIQGRNAIAEYFAKEAVGMKFCPEYVEIVMIDGVHSQYQIQGKVATSLFTVNVGWLIKLNVAKEIMNVEVKLLNSLGDLLKFKS